MKIIRTGVTKDSHNHRVVCHQDTQLHVRLEALPYGTAGQHAGGAVRYDGGRADVPGNVEHAWRVDVGNATVQTNN